MREVQEVKKCGKLTLRTFFTLKTFRKLFQGFPILGLTTHVQLTLATTTSQALEIFFVNFTLATTSWSPKYLTFLTLFRSWILLGESLASLALLTLVKDCIFLEESLASLTFLTLAKNLNFSRRVPGTSGTSDTTKTEFF